MVNLAAALGDNVALVAHMDSTPEAHAHADSFRAHETLFRYDGSFDNFVSNIFSEIDSSDGHDFYICGSPSFTRDTEEALRAGEHGRL
jgi:hypothetical protein